jgi:hypothetical protein
MHWIGRTFPVTLGVMGFVLVVGWQTSGNSHDEHHALMRRVGIDLRRLLNGDLWSLPASTVIQSSPGISPSLAVLIAGSVGALELRSGHIRALIVFLLSDWVSAPLTILITWMLARAGSPLAGEALQGVDTGSSAAAFGALGAVLASLPRPWSLLTLGGLVAGLASRVRGEEIAPGLAHLLGTAVGAVLGALLGRSSLGSKSDSERSCPASR